MANEELIERYPFLIPRTFFGEPKVTDYTLLDEMPPGWRKAFGEQMCEEIRAELIKMQEIHPEGGYPGANGAKIPYLYGYYPVQIKEKFGRLCWYDNGAPKGSQLHDIIRKYEALSQQTCINCGKPAKWISTHWIAPWCDDCRFIGEDLTGDFRPLN